MEGLAAGHQCADPGQTARHHGPGFSLSKFSKLIKLPLPTCKLENFTIPFHSSGEGVDIAPVCLLMAGRVRE